MQNPPFCHDCFLLGCPLACIFGSCTSSPTLGEQGRNTPLNCARLSSSGGFHAQIFEDFLTCFTQRLWLQLVQGWILCFLLLTSCCCLPPGCSSPLSTESKSPSMPSRASMRSICNCTRRCKILLTVSKWVFCLGLLSRLPHFCKYKGEICCA